jgi:hypothetical protein
MKFEDIKKELDLHIQRIDDILDKIEYFSEFPNFDDSMQVAIIDSFAFRFSKIQDKMGEKLFPYALMQSYEYKDDMTVIDVLNKLEKHNLLDKNEWVSYRGIRNLLTHEYKENHEEIIDGIKDTLIAYKKIKNIYKNTIKFILKQKEVLNEQS